MNEPRPTTGEDEAASAPRSQHARRRLAPYGLLAPGLSWLALFFVVPMVYMGILALRSGTFETGFVFTWEFNNFPDALDLYNEQFIRSFIYAGIATLIALVIAYPLAYAIAFRAGRWKNLLLFAVVAPFFTTYLIRTLGWTTILSDSGVVVDSLKFVGLLGDDGRLLATPVAVVAGITYNYLPFMVLPIYASLERIDVRLIEAGRDLYSSAAQTFWRITLPISLPGVVAGTLLTFIPAAGDYVNVAFLGGTNQSMVGNAIQSLYIRENEYALAAALSFMFMAAILILVLIYIRFAGSEALMGDEEDAR